MSAPATLPLARALSGALSGDLAADSRSLDALKRDATRDPQGAIRSAARQFEALFMQMVLKSMREAMPKSGLLESSAGEMYTGMLDQQLADRLAGGTGLADLIARQLTRQVTRQRRPADATPIAGQARSAALRAVDETPPVAGADRQRAFVDRTWDHALAASRTTGLPAKFIVGQAALESGWGRNEIKGADGLPSFNLFGIKASAGWQGRTVEATTTEYVDGVAVKKIERFRAYDNYGESFRDWARLLAGSPRYAPVLAQTDAAGFADGLQRAGYATDPHYGAKLKRLIETAQALRRA